LIYTCVVRVSAPASAYDIVPRIFDKITLSSLIFRFSQAAETDVLPAIPNWTTNPGTTRKKPLALPVSDEDPK